MCSRMGGLFELETGKKLLLPIQGDIFQELVTLLFQKHPETDDEQLLIGRYNVLDK